MLDESATIDDIEAAYLAALEAAEAAEAGLEDAVQEPGLASAAEAESVDGSGTDLRDTDLGAAPVPTTAVAPPATAHVMAPPAVHPHVKSATGASPGPTALDDDRPPVTQRQVIEAILFVGGEGLTAGRMAQALGGDLDETRIHELVDEIRTAYIAERRPYRVELSENGYRLALTADYERIRARVFGVGPKEIKLAQEALEILAFIAYRQPTTPEALEATGRKGVAAIVRQLLRRELVQLERDPDNAKQVRYRTTDRFLELFGLAHLDDLPHPADFAFK